MLSEANKHWFRSQMACTSQATRTESRLSAHLSAASNKAHSGDANNGLTRKKTKPHTVSATNQWCWQIQQGSGMHKTPLCSGSGAVRKRITRPFPAGPQEAGERQGLGLGRSCSDTSQHTLHSAPSPAPKTFCQAAHTFQATLKASSRCRSKQTECASEKRN